MTCFLPYDLVLPPRIPVTTLTRPRCAGLLRSIEVSGETTPVSVRQIVVGPYSMLIPGADLAAWSISHWFVRRPVTPQTDCFVTLYNASSFPQKIRVEWICVPKPKTDSWRVAVRKWTGSGYEART